MHEEWLDLIPYYVNRTMPDGERAAFERHLAVCDDCRRAVDDWNLVAGTVYREVDRWAQQSPALSAQVRARLALPLSSNGHGHSAAAFAPDETFAVHAMRQPSRRSRLPLTMVAAAAMILAVGVLVLMIASRDNESATPLSELDSTGTPEQTPPATLGAVTATPPPAQARTLTPAEVSDLGIQPAMKTPTPTPSLTASRLPPTQPPRPSSTLTPTLYWPVTPTAAYQYGIGSGFVMVMTTQVGAIPAGARVRISHAWYDGSTWLYAVVAEDEQTYAEARESQLAFAPDVTPGPVPTAAYQDAIGMGYLMITTAQVGAIPVGTRVRISHAWHNGYGWLYAIQAHDSQTIADAAEWQIAYAPDVTPGPTPTAVFGSVIGMGYVLRTTEQVGGIPAGTRVRISAGWFDGFGWTYDIVAEDGTTTAQARTSQLAYDPSPAPSTTPYPPPTASAQPPPTCPYAPTLTAGCPATQKTVQAVYQSFENGTMVWRDDTRMIYVLYDKSSQFETYPDTWREGEPISINETPPPGRTAPTRGFGKLWAAEPGIRNTLGWALSAETGYITLWETYTSGDSYFRMLSGSVVHLTSDGRWFLE